MSSKIALAMDFSSFLIEKVDTDKIKNIILFGSVSRQEDSEESDIDLFIDLVNDDIKVEEEIKKILERFYNSTKFRNYWKPLGIKNEINLSIGILEEWKLYSSVVANGITLYGKYKHDLKGEHYTYFMWENIKPNSKRVIFNKQIFGYSQGNRYYEGMLDRYKGERLGKGCIVVPSEYTVVFHKLFKKNEITVKIKRVVEY